MALKVGGTTVVDDSRQLTNVTGIDATTKTTLETALTNVNANTLDGQDGSYYTGYTDTAIANLVASAPTTLDTLNELAAALGDDPNFATTVTNSIATKLPLSGGTMTGALNFGDNVKAQFGAGSDLQIYHDGSKSLISDQGQGNLVVAADNFEVNSASNTANKITAQTGGAVNLFFNNQNKLSTTSTGVDVTGTVTADALTVDGDTQINSASAAASGTRSIQFYRDSTERGALRFDYSASTMELQADGNLYISSGGENTRFYVSSIGDISFYEDTGTTPKFFWDASAEALGIGTSSPITALQISGTNATVTLSDTNASGGSYSSLLFRNTDGLSNTYNIASVIGLTTGNGGNGALAFYTASSNSNTERMRIDASGNVGIGTSSPAAKLDVVGGDALINGATVGFGGGALNSNLAFGSNALANNTTGYENIAFGQLALQNNTTGIWLAASGYGALQSNTTGGFNTAYGANVLGSNTTGNGNTGIGNNALTSNTTASGSVAIGNGALSLSTTGSNNVGVGVSVFLSNTTGSFNVAVGANALRSNTTASLNTAVGRNALRLSTTGANNTGVGENSGYSITTGSNNTIIGRFSGNQSSLNIITASNNIVLSDGSGEPRQYYLGADNAWVFRTNTTERMRIDSSGNLLIGGATAGTSSAGNLVLVNGTAPTGNVTNGITLYAEDVSSSSELKVRDEAGNVTTLSPHNFDLIPEGPSEDMAWSYYSERDGKRINVDMLKAIRLLEQLSGEKLVHMA